MEHQATWIYKDLKNIKNINGKFYGLRFYRDNSAPCSKCAFLDKKTFSCIHPNKDGRNCSYEDGATKGWNTWEYEFIPNEYIIYE